MPTKYPTAYHQAYYQTHRDTMLANAAITDEVRRRQRGAKVRGKFVSKSESNRRYREKQKQLKLLS